jgi:hypothetical protein
MAQIEAHLKKMQESEDLSYSEQTQINADG